MNQAAIIDGPTTMAVVLRCKDGSCTLDFKLVMLIPWNYSENGSGNNSVRPSSEALTRLRTLHVC